MKILPVLPLALALMTTAVSAETDKEKDCGYQADVAGAVQKARLDGVSEKKVRASIEATNPAWPERYNNAIPVFAAQIYQIKKRNLKKIDLRSEWLGTCLGN